jgi:phage FluMu gp28-like protein
MNATYTMPDGTMPASISNEALDEALQGQSIEEFVEKISRKQAQAYEDAEVRWAFCKEEVEPNIAEASNNIESAKTGLLPNHEFQIRNSAPTSAGVKSRKIAWSWGYSLCALAWCATVDRTTVTIQSFDEDEAKEKNNYLEWIYASLRPGLRRILKMSDGQDQRRFKNGSRIRFVARKPTTGANGSIFIDEFSIQRKGSASAEELLIAALGAITHGGAVQVGGTQRGPNTMFNKIISGSIYKEINDNPLYQMLPKVQWEVGEFPWWTSPALCKDVRRAIIFAPKMDTHKRVLLFGNDALKFQFVHYTATPNLGLEIFQREFEGKVLDDSESYFPMTLIETSYLENNEYVPSTFYHCELDGSKVGRGPDEMNKAFNIIRALKRLVVLGIMPGDWGYAFDLGRHHDLGELVIGHTLPRDKNTLILRAVISFNKVPFPLMRQTLDMVLSELPIIRGGIDATRGGMGVDMGETYNLRYGVKAQPIEFTTPNKQIMATGMRTRMECHGWLMPDPDGKSGFRKLVHQMLQVKKNVSEGNGTVTFDIDRNENWHGDCFWASAMLSHLFTTPGQFRAARSVAMEQVSNQTGIIVPGNSQIILPAGHVMPNGLWGIPGVGFPAGALGSGFNGLGFGG